MKSFTKILALGAVIAASSSIAFATPVTGSVAISEKTGGTASFSNTSISFTPDTGHITNSTLPGPTTFMGLDVTLSNVTFATANGVTLFTVTSGADTLSYVISSATVAGYSAGVFLDVTGTGTFYDTGFDNTPGTFILTASDSGVVNFEITGTAASVAPEPNSLLLMGTGLVSAGALLFMRRRNGAMIG